MAREGKFIHANGIRLHYYDWGGDGPPVMLVHGGTFGGFLWGPFAEFLSKHYRVLALDRRGHGDSEAPAVGYSTIDDMNDFKAFGDALGLGPYIGMGDSTGAAAMSMLAGTQPGFFKALVMLEPGWRLNPPQPGPAEATEARPPQRERRMVYNSREEMYERYKGRGGLKNWRDDITRLYIWEGTNILPDGTVELKCQEAWRNDPNGRQNPHSWPMISKLTCPTLCIRGADSNTVGDDVVEYVKAHMPNVTVETVAGDHHIPMEIPEALAERAMKFLQDVGVAPAAAAR